MTSPLPTQQGVDFCLAETMPEERIPLGDLNMLNFTPHGQPAQVIPRQHAPPACSGPQSHGRMYYGRHARMYNHTSANSDYSDYYSYELYSPPALDTRQLKGLSRGLFKLKIAYIVLTIFVVLSITAFILMNPSVSPFLAEDKCFKCKVVEDLCVGKIEVLENARDRKRLDTCCFTHQWQMIKLLGQCKRQWEVTGTTTKKP